MKQLWNQAKFVAGYEKVIQGSKLPYWFIVVEVFIHDLFAEVQHYLEML